MRGSRLLSLRSVAAALIVAPCAASSNADGPPPAHTGGFGEPTCQACHVGAPLNSPDGALLLGGLPERYGPGGSYELVVVLRHPSREAAGFEMSARFASAEALGRQAGSLMPLGNGMSVTRDTSSAVSYVHHTDARAGLVPGLEARWRVRWQAPNTGGTVVFNLSGNAANDDNSPLGDFIYAIEARTRPAGRAP